jgi:hypothetical protein
MKPISIFVQDELKRTGDGSVLVDGAKVRLLKRTNKERMTRVHMIKCVGVYLLGKKIVSTNARAREMAISLSNFVYSGLAVQETWSVAVSPPTTTPSGGNGGLSQREVQTVANMDFVALLSSLRPIKRGVDKEK